MSIDQFEWQSEQEPAGPASAERAGPGAAAAELREPAADSWRARLRQSLWLEPALRVLGVALLLGILAGIGWVATSYAKPGIEQPLVARGLAAAFGTTWLKPTAAPTADSSAAGHGEPLAAAPSPPLPPSSGLPDRGAAAPTSSTTAPAPSQPGAAPPSGLTADGKVILNLASAEDLTKLPGVGPKRAEAIIALRTKLKRFKHPSELLRVKGIGPKGLQRMLPHLVLDG